MLSSRKIKTNTPANENQANFPQKHPKITPGVYLECNRREGPINQLTNTVRRSFSDGGSAVSMTFLSNCLEIWSSADHGVRKICPDNPIL